MDKLLLLQIFEIVKFHLFLYITKYVLYYGNTLFYVSSLSSYRRDYPFTSNIEQATVFTDHASAVSKLILLKKMVNKQKGYLYISKVFYKEFPTSRFNKSSGDTKFIATKLTKPDRHDFLQAI